MRGGREEVGADSRPGVLLCVALFRISSPRRLQTNPWRPLPYAGNTSFRQTDRRSDFPSPNTRNTPRVLSTALIRVSFAVNLHI